MVLTDERGLSLSDEDVYRKLIHKLRGDVQEKISIQDFLDAPALREVFESKDKKTWNLPINFPGDGSAAQTQQAYRHVAHIVRESVAGSGLHANLTGPVATISDFQQLGDDDARIIELGTAFSVLVILIIVFRNLVTMLLPIITIGVSVFFAQGVLSALAEYGLALNMQAVAFISAVMIGAGTDYAVFLVSRYHDYVRQGLNSDQAVKRALPSIGKVIVASAATVAITFLAMVFTKLRVFSAVGPATAISIAVSLLAAMTLLPAILVLAGRRGWVAPRRDRTSRLWFRSGAMIARRPVKYLAGSLVALIALAMSASLIHLSFDDVRFLPDDVGSVAGYAEINRHFPVNTITPAILSVQSPRDLRTPAALADLEAMADRISDLPDVIAVRGLTRPRGTPVEQMTASFQAGEVGSRLNEVASAIGNRAGELEALAAGGHQVAGALARLREQVTGAIAGADGLVAALEEMRAAMTVKIDAQLDNAAELAGRMAGLSSNLGAAVADAQQIAVWANPMVNALNFSPVCSSDPACVRSRAQLQAIVEAHHDGTLRSIAALAASFHRDDPRTVGLTLKRLEEQLNQAIGLVNAAGGLRARMAQMTQGANTLADGSAAVADGVQQLVDRTTQVGAGLGEASAFLLDIKRDAHTRSMTGFYVPPQFTSRDEYREGAAFFISDDGHSARYFIQSAFNPFTAQAMDQLSRIITTAHATQPNTELLDASIAITGITAGLKDTHDYYMDDMEFIFIATVGIVFVILAVLLRAIVAPLYLIASVLISYLSALGSSVLVFQLMMGQEMHWSLPGLSFVCLVAVGADYNMLLISRIREESSSSVRIGVIRTVGSTGGVITSAGMIFAASMFGLLAASISTMVQAGFTIGIGILLDTFLVRTATVPALVAIIGQASWWPHTARLKSLKLTAPLRRLLLKYFPAGATQVDCDGKVADTSPLAEPQRKKAASAQRRALQGDLGIHALPLFTTGDGCGLSTQSPSRTPLAPVGAAGGFSISGDECLRHSLPLFDA